MARLTQAQVEASKRDAAQDKKKGITEGSPMDTQMDNSMMGRGSGKGKGAGSKYGKGK